MSGRRLAAAVALAATLGPAPSVGLEWPGRAAGLQAGWDEGDATRREDLLGRIDAVDDPAMLAFLQMAAGSPDVGVRAEAARAIGRSGAWALEELLAELLTDRASEVRVAAAMALGDLALPGAVEPLVRARGDADEDVRVAVIDALGRLGEPDATLAIVDALNDSSRPVVIAALDALARLGHRGALYAVLEKLADPMRDVAIAATGVVAELRAVEAVPALAELVESGAPEVAVAAIEALGAIRSRAATPTLVGQVLKPRVDGAREAALDALEATADSAALVVLDLLDGSDATDLAPLVTAIGGAAAEPLAERYARVDPASAEGMALLNLWLRSGDPRAVEALDAAWATGVLDADLDERLEWLAASPSALAWCRRADGAGVPSTDTAWHDLLEGAAVPGVADCLLDLVDPVPALTPDVAVRVVEALAAVGRPEAVDIADRFVDAARLDGETGLRLVVALRALGDDGVGGLARLLTVDDDVLRRDVANALADRTVPWVDADRIDALVARHTVRVDVLLALDGQQGQPAVAAAIADATGSTALDVRTAARSVAPCDAIDRAALDADRADGVPMLYRREAWRVASACGWLAGDAALQDDVDPVVRAIALSAASALPAIDTVGSLDERLEVVARASDVDALARIARQRDPVLAAAAVMRLHALDPQATSMGWMRGAAADAPVLRAAWYAVAPDDADARSHALRRERHPAVRAVLGGAAAMTAPVIVSAVDLHTGARRPNELVIGLTVDAALVHGRTDVFGRLRWDRDDLVAVFVVGAAS